MSLFLSKVLVNLVYQVEQIGTACYKVILGKNRWLLKRPNWAMSHEKSLDWLGYIGDEKLPSYMGIIISHNKDPLLNNQYNGK